MPEPATLLVFLLAALALIAIPGPNHIYIATRSIGQGRAAGLASAFGVETGTLVHVAAAAVGLSALIASSALAFDVVRFAGAAYLVFLGLRELLWRRDLELERATVDAPLHRVFAEGVLVNVLNPKVALFFLAFLPQFVDPARGSASVQIVVLGLALIVIALASDVLYALAGGALGSWLRRRPAFLRRQRYVTGGVYLALGVVAALSGGRQRA